MESNIGEALGISLFEVQAKYFRDNDVGEELIEEKSYRDVIKNHYQSGRYATKDVDGILFIAYNSDD
jgi:hypothetical protein